MKKNIVWLASYPKSGNTWMRVFLANYLSNQDQPVSINQMQYFGMGDAIASYYHKVAGRRIDNKDANLTLGLRDRVLRAISGNNADINLVKTHSIRRNAGHVPLIPDQYTRSAIYILRNPLDMVLSYARHYSLTPKTATEQICHRDNALIADDTSVTTYLGSWSEHVESWAKKPTFPTLVLRYEDMLHDPESAFGQALEHIGMPIEPERLERAIRFSSFKELKKQEKKEGFVEKTAGSESFFTKGEAGQWKDNLESSLRRIIRKSHRDVMKHYGYYNE